MISISKLDILKKIIYKFCIKKYNNCFINMAGISINIVLIPCNHTIKQSINIFIYVTLPPFYRVQKIPLLNLRLIKYLKFRSC